MKKLIYLLLAMVMVINLAYMGLGCSKKEPEKPAAKEEPKPPEAKPAEAPAPAAPAATPAPAEPAKK